MTERDVSDAAENPSEIPQNGEDYHADNINGSFALVLIGGRALVMQENWNAPIHERLRLLSVDAFHTWMANRYDFIRGKAVAWSRLWLSDSKRRSYRGIEFAPHGGREGYYNLWRGFEVDPDQPGTCDQFLHHVFHNVAQEKPDLFYWIMGWFAHIVQHPEERLGTSLVLRGPMGCGKTVVGEMVGSLFAPHYFLVDDPRYIFGQFNAHMASCLLLQADEGFWAGDKASEGRLKGLVTSDMQMIEHKGVDPIRMPNLVRLLITSNDDWVVPAGPEERRFCVVDVGKEKAQDHKYFGAMHEEMNNGGRSALLHYLLNFDLSKVNLRVIPHSDALFEQKLRTMHPEESWWFHRLRDGGQLREQEWSDFVQSRALYDDYVAYSDQLGARRKVEENTIFMRFKKWCPAVRRVRRTVTVGGEYSAYDIERVRRWGYEFPSLDIARAAFSDFLKTDIDWTVGEEEQTGSGPPVPPPP